VEISINDRIISGLIITLLLWWDILYSTNGQKNQSCEMLISAHINISPKWCVGKISGIPLQWKYFKQNQKHGNYQPWIIARTLK
jgi:hypothetical protein